MNRVSIGRRTTLRRLLGVGLVCLAGAAVDLERLQAATPPTPEATQEELFAAIESGAVEARVVARDPHHVRVFLKNTTQRPLSVKLPDAIAARPVLAQGGFFGNGGGQGAGFGMSTSTGGSQAPQAVGGATMTGTSRPGGIFAIPPESVREMKLDTVCLEHGKPNPRSSVKYELAKLDEVCAEPAVQSLLVRYGQGGLDRDTVQAAAWNLANGLAWRELENMTEPVALNAVKPVYSSEQLQTARRLAETAKKEVAARKQPTETKAAATKTITVEGQTIEFSTINARK